MNLDESHEAHLKRVAEELQEILRKNKMVITHGHYDSEIRLIKWDSRFDAEDNRKGSPHIPFHYVPYWEGGSLNSLGQFVGKYVEVIINDDECTSAAGWVVRIDAEMELIETDENGPEKVNGRMLHFDYGMGFFISYDCSVREVEPPEDDPGMFVPDTSRPDFP